jgi:SAM-dependent methyltransferase
VNNKVNRFAIDLSSSVEIAFEKTNTMSNVFIAQADLFKLPFPDSFFDIIFSGGVLHHTGNARSGFAHLCKHLRPGGIIGIFVYKVKPFLRELADREIKKITTEISYDECEKFAEQITKLGRALQRVKEKLYLDEDIPLLNIEKGEYDVQKFIYDHFLKCYYNKKIGYDFSVLANIDWYRPKHASHHTREEVASWFEENNLVDVRFNDLKGWEHASFFVSGRKEHGKNS